MNGVKPQWNKNERETFNFFSFILNNEIKKERNDKIQENHTTSIIYIFSVIFVKLFIFKEELEFKKIYNKEYIYNN